MKLPRLKLLLLCDFHEGSAGAIVDHIRAIERYSRHEIQVLSNLGELPRSLDLDQFDGLIIHYSLAACYDSFIAPSARRRIRQFSGFKCAFVQDDYRFVDRTVEALRYLRIDALFALPGPEILDQVYSPDKLPGVRKITVLTGYVPEELTRVEVPPFENRPIDVGYRARKLPAWIGSHTLQKWQISDRFAADAPRFGLTVDLSYREEDRIYGQQWIDFVGRCKSMLGTESGASVCDFTGKIQENVEKHLSLHPHATFEELRELYFKNEDGKVMMNIISPRCFEAAALRTLMVLYEGHYSGVLVPWRHYVPLKLDHSNMDQVAAVIRDSVRAREIVDCAFHEIATSGRYSYRAMVSLVDRTIDDTATPKMLRANRERSWSTNPRLVEERSELATRMYARHRGVSPGAAQGTGRHATLFTTLLKRFTWRRLLLALQASTSQVTEVDDVDPEFLTHDLDHLDRIVAFFAATPDAEAWLMWNRLEGSAAFVAVWPGIAIGDQDRRIELEEFDEALLGGALHNLLWINDDALGLGTAPPLQEFHQFLELSALAKQSPSRAHAELFPRLRSRGWLKRVVETNRSMQDLVDVTTRVVELIATPVRIETKLKFYPGHEMSAACDGRDDTYAAALEGQATPQCVTFRLGRPKRIIRIDIVWESDANRAREFVLSVHCKAQQRCIIGPVKSTGQHATVTVPFVDADAISLEISSFVGQPRLLMRAFKIVATPSRVA